MMIFRFNYKNIEHLPALAWLADADNESKVVTVYCGNAVECREDFFVTGAWDGNFENADFDQSEVFFGTGAKLVADGIAFITPSHALERLVSSQKDNRYVISNSLPFLMSYCGLNLDRTINQYERMFCSILDGPNKMCRQIPMQDGNTINQYIVSTVMLHDDGSVEVLRRRATAPFSSFDDYYSRLVSSMKAVMDNANSDQRQKLKYGITSTLSSGYDSSTCCAVARELGCDTVVTLSGGQYDKDNGTDIARQLGYENIIKRDMNEYKQRTDCIDAEFLASGELGTTLQFSVFEDVFRNKLVLFGLRGSYWDKSNSIKTDFEMDGYFNCEADVSITENALKNCYLVIPMPTFGASAFDSIKAVTNSEEMKPWTLGGEYDKPIPRRILETAGVSRESFGQVKYGGGFSFYRDNLKRLSKRMSTVGFQNFTEFVAGHKGTKLTCGRISNFTLFTIANLPSYANYAFSKCGISLKLHQPAFRIANAGAAADLIFWGVDVMKARYAKALSQCKSEESI